MKNAKEAKARKKLQKEQVEDAIYKYRNELRRQILDAIGLAWDDLNIAIEGGEEGSHPIPFPRFLMLFKQAWNMAVCATPGMALRFPNIRWGTDDHCELNTIRDVLHIYQEEYPDNSMLLHDLSGNDSAEDRTPTIRYTLNHAAFLFYDTPRETAKRIATLPDAPAPFSEEELARIRAANASGQPDPELIKAIVEKSFLTAQAVLNHLGNEAPLLSQWFESEL